MKSTGYLLEFRCRLMHMWTDSLTKGDTEQWGKRIIFPNERYQEKHHTICKKQFQVDYRSKQLRKKIKLSEDNTDEYLCDLEIGKDFLNIIQRILTRKENNDKLDITIKILCYQTKHKACIQNTYRISHNKN